MTETKDLVREFRFERHDDLPPDGPWVDEPDKVQWVDEKTGLDCMVKRNDHGAWCGYVGVTKGHPFYGISYSEIYDRFPEVEIDVHGGLTFSDKCHEGLGDDAICHVPFPGRDGDVWWLGFDCAHAFDLSPLMGYRMHEYDPERWPWPPVQGVLGADVYRTVDFAKNECRKLAASLAEAH